jgi:YbbR domain-containing protein
VDLIDPRKNIITLNPDKITVAFEIEQIVERTIYDVPIQIVGLPANLIATPSPRSISLRVKGGESIVTGVTRDELTVFFDFAKNYKPGRLIYDVQIETPENVSWTSASPDKFRLQLKRVDSES